MRDVKALTQRTAVNTQAKLSFRLKDAQHVLCMRSEIIPGFTSAATNEDSALGLGQVSETRSPRCSVEMLPFLA